MSLFFIFLTFISFTYFFLKKRKVDLFLVSFVSSIIYFSPLFFGYVVEPSWSGTTRISMKVDIQSEVYFVASLVLIFNLIFALIYDAKNKTSNQITVSFSGGKFFLLLYSILMWGALIYLYINNQGDLFSGKVNVLASSGFIYLFLRTCSFLFVFSILSKNKVLILNSTIILVITFLIGIRSFLAVALISLIIVYFFKADRVVLFKKIRPIFVLFLAVFGYIMFNGKNIYASFQTNGFKGILNTLSSPETFIHSLSQSEPFGIQMILNRIVAQENYIGYTILFDAFLEFFYIDYLFNIETYNFSTSFTNANFSFVDYGMAYNIWAEALVIGGYFYLIIFLSLFNITILIINTLIFRIEFNELRALLLIVGVYLTFYIHRNSLTSILTIEKTIIAFVVVLLIFSYVIFVLITNEKIFWKYRFNKGGIKS